MTRRHRTARHLWQEVAGWELILLWPEQGWKLEGSVGFGFGGGDHAEWGDGSGEGDYWDDGEGDWAANGTGIQDGQLDP